MSEMSGTHELHTVDEQYSIFSILSSGNDVKGSEKRRTPSVLFKKSLNASKPSEHPPQVEECLKV